MTEREGVSIHGLATGVPGLDQVLGGDIPEYSFNLIAGEPGTGKTTLAQQILFANTTPERPAIYFTVLGEPTLKMLRYQQQFAFFDVGAVGKSIHFVNLSDLALEQDLQSVLERIVREVEQIQPSLVVVDSFRTVLRAVVPDSGAELGLQSFLQRLAIQLTNQQVTSFLVGEYSEAEVHDNPIFTVADGILWMLQKAEGNASVRKLQAVKMRGRASIPGLHPFRISADGIRVFPRIGEVPARPEARRSSERLSTGIAGLDEMMGGGIPAGDAVLVAGPAGSGKTLVGMQFMIDGLRRGEAGVIAMFEEYPEEYLVRARTLGADLERSIQEDRLRLLRLRPLDLSVDEVLQELQQAVAQLGATRVVIDSLSGFEVGLAMTEGEELRQSLYRMIATLTGLGVTVLMTAEVAEAFAPPRFSSNAVSFLTDDIIMQRFVELNGYIHSVIGVVKMRRSPHSRALRLYEITPQGLVMDMVLRGYNGIITGVPVQRGLVESPAFPGLTGRESAVLQSLMELHHATAEDLHQQTGIVQEDLTSILQRLVAMRYITEAILDDEKQYQYQAQPRDAMQERIG
jgi:circadian clock protein KaiC